MDRLYDSPETPAVYPALGRLLYYRAWRPLRSDSGRRSIRPAHAGSGLDVARRATATSRTSAPTDSRTGRSWGRFLTASWYCTTATIRRASGRIICSWGRRQTTWLTRQRRAAWWVRGKHEESRSCAETAILPPRSRTPIYLASSRGGQPELRRQPLRQSSESRRARSASSCLDEGAP